METYSLSGLFHNSSLTAGSFCASTLTMFLLSNKTHIENKVISSYTEYVFLLNNGHKTLIHFNQK